MAKIDLVDEIERELADINARFDHFNLLIQAYSHHRDATGDAAMRKEMDRRVEIVTAAAEDELGRRVARTSAALKALVATN